MILAIADDLTGAAEIGGVALRFGLQAEVQIGRVLQSAADVVAVDTSTRSLPEQEAARAIRALGPLESGRIFKKVDSVLRGPVIAELLALMDATGRRRALLVPGNPRLGRTVHHGTYWIDGVPISETDFRRDPEYPVTSSDIPDMLGAPGVIVATPGADLPASGIIVGEAATEEQVLEWAGRVDETTLAAGAASMFAAVLRRGGSAAGEPARAYEVRYPILVVSGSTSEHSRNQIGSWAREGTPVFSIRTVREAASVLHALRTGPRVVLTGFGPELYQLVEEVLCGGHAGEVWVEGGATASGLVRHLGWRRLSVVEERAPGVVGLVAGVAGAPVLVMKPGSYAWPQLQVRS